MAGKEKKTPIPYIVEFPQELPGEASEQVRIAYNGFSRTCVTLAFSPKDAVGNCLFRTYRNKTVARVLSSLLSPYARKYAFAVPDVYDADNGGRLDGLEREIAEEYHLAQEIAAASGRTPERCLHRARQLMDFYRKNRADLAA